MEIEEVARLDRKAPKESHSMVVVNGDIYVIDGDKFLRMHVPVKTIWERIVEIFVKK